MKDIRAILEEHASSLDDAARSAILRDVQDNYRTVAEVEKKTQRITELETRQEELAAQVGNLEGQGEEVEGLKAKVAEFEAKERDRLARAEEASKRDAFVAAFDNALDGKRFANDLVRESVLRKAMDLCGSDSTVGVREAIEASTKDVPGVWHNPQRDPAKMPDHLSISTAHDDDEGKAMRSLANTLFGRQD